MAPHSSHRALQLVHLTLGIGSLGVLSLMGGSGPAALGLVALGLGLGALAPAAPGCLLRIETPIWLALIVGGAPLEGALLAASGAALARAREPATVMAVAVAGARGAWLGGLAFVITASMVEVPGTFAVLGGLLALATADALEERSLALHLSGWMGAASLGVLAAEQPDLERGLLLLPLLAVFQLALDALRRSSESARREAELTALAERDELTGLGNVRGFRRHVQTRRGEQLGMVVLDLDGFKELNDTHGHFAGDRALKAVGEVLAQAGGVRFFRTGGDEFVGVWSPAELGEDERCESVRRDLERLEVPVRGGTFPIRVSMGAAVGLFDGSPALRGAADAEMYADKRLRFVENLTPGARLVFERFDDRLGRQQQHATPSQKAS